MTDIEILIAIAAVLIWGTLGGVATALIPLPEDGTDRGMIAILIVLTAPLTFPAALAHAGARWIAQRSDQEAPALPPATALRRRRS